MPAVGATAVTPAQMVSLGENKIGTVHIKIFWTQRLVACNRILLTLWLRVTGIVIHRLLTPLAHEKSPGAAAGCAGRDTMASARKRSAMDRCRFNFAVGIVADSSSTTTPFRN